MSTTPVTSVSQVQPRASIQAPAAHPAQTITPRPSTDTPSIAPDTVTISAAAKSLQDNAAALPQKPQSNAPENQSR